MFPKDAPGILQNRLQVCRGAASANAGNRDGQNGRGQQAAPRAAPPSRAHQGGEFVQPLTSEKQGLFPAHVWTARPTGGQTTDMARANGPPRGLR